MGPSTATDDALARRVAQGDERAFEALVARYAEPLRRYCWSITGSAEDADEAVQTTLLNAHRALVRGAGPATVRSWLFRIAHNACLNLVRDRPRWTSLDPALADTDRQPFDQSVARERVRRLRADLEVLEPAPRTALLLRELAGMSHGEIAGVLGEGADAATAKRLIREAREALHDIALGREMPCPDIRRTISDGDGRVMRSRRMRSHLRDCEECATFRTAIGTRAHDLAALAAVPAAAGALRALVGAATGSGAGASALTAGGGSTGGLLAALAGVGIGAKVAAVATIAVMAGAGTVLPVAASQDRSSAGPARAVALGDAARVAPVATSPPARTPPAAGLPGEPPAGPPLIEPPEPHFTEAAEAAPAPRPTPVDAATLPAPPSPPAAGGSPGTITAITAPRPEREARRASPPERPAAGTRRPGGHPGQAPAPSHGPPTRGAPRREEPARHTPPPERADPPGDAGRRAERADPPARADAPDRTDRADRRGPGAAAPSADAGPAESTSPPEHAGPPADAGPPPDVDTAGDAVAAPPAVVPAPPGRDVPDRRPAAGGRRP